MRAFLAVAIVSAVALSGAPSRAAIIATGTPVDAAGNAVAGGNVTGSGWIDFYVPLSGGYAGTFGVGGVGLTSTYSSGGSGTPGSMDMYLKFSPATGGNALHFQFEDLDLIGVNDPYGFFESVAIYNQDMTVEFANIDDKNDAGVLSADRNAQELLIPLTDVLPLADTFIAKLRFAAGPVRGYNTAERIKANLVAVSEPDNLMIYSVGLLVMVVFVARRKTARA